MRKSFVVLRNFAPFIALSASLAACGSGPPAPGSPEFVIQRHDNEVAQTKTAAVEAPDWFVNPPKDGGFVYAAGSASSADLQFSIDKAILNAKYQLADQVNGKLSGKQKDFISEGASASSGIRPVGTAERTTSNVIADVALPGYQVVNRKVVPVDTQYRTYVLLKFPVAKIEARNDQTAADGQAALQKQAKAAFDDLQAEMVTVKDPPVETIHKKVVAYPIGMAPPNEAAPAVMAPDGVLQHSSGVHSPASGSEPPMPVAAPRPAVAQDSL